MAHLNYDDLLKEVRYSFSRSSGSGGQHVNTTESRVELYFSIPNSQVLDQDTKQKLLETLSSKLDTEGVLRITSSTERSQIANRKIAQEKFIELIKKSLQPVKKRKKTKPSKAAKEIRLEFKKKKSQKKESRKKVTLE